MLTDLTLGSGDRAVAVALRADAGTRPFVLRVEKDNPRAQEFYARAGFTAYDETAEELCLRRVSA